MTESNHFSDSSAHGHSESFSISRSYGVGHGVTETHGATHAHTCTRECARLHLSGDIQAFEKRLRRLAKTLPVADFVWLRAQYEDAFDRVLFEGME